MTDPIMRDQDILLIDCTEEQWKATCWEANPELTEDQVDRLYDEFLRRRLQVLKTTLVH